MKRGGSLAESCAGIVEEEEEDYCGWSEYDGVGQRDESGEDVNESRAPAEGDAKEDAGGDDSSVDTDSAGDGEGNRSESQLVAGGVLCVAVLLVLVLSSLNAALRRF